MSCITLCFPFKSTSVIDQGINLDGCWVKNKVADVVKRSGLEATVKLEQLLPFLK